jgi:type IV pilus assembly protein PilN
MIRINLLPFRAARKRENIRQQISVYIGIVVLTLLVIGFLSIQKISQASDKKAEEESLKSEIVSYQKELDELKAVEKKTKEVNLKLDVIKELEKGKTGPVLLLADVADSVPKGKLWLRSYSEKKGSLSLVGTAMDNETVALFMSNLEKTQQITTVDLESAEQRDIAQYSLKVSDFVLKCGTVAEEKKATAKNGTTTKKTK